MATTANTLIQRALQLIGVIAAGENPTSDDLADGLVTLNDMVNAWALEPLTIFTEQRVTAALSASTQNYTIGAGATISTPRPLWVPNAGIIPSGATNELPINLLSDDQWAGIAIKSLTSVFPTAMYYNYDFNATTGYGLVAVWPIPTTTPTLVLYLPEAVTAFADGTTSYKFPPGYERMLRFNLAVELAPEYGRQVDPAVGAIAMQSKGNIKRANNREQDLIVDASLLRKSGLFNFRTGEAR